MNSENQTLNAQRAIEALRAGVPNRAAVAALGSIQTAIDDRFTDVLDRVQSPAGRAVGGMLLAGGYGAGKSHALESLAHRALDAGFVVSKVVISKETALHDATSVFQSAIEVARVPGRTGPAIESIAASLKSDSAGMASVRRWVNDSKDPIMARFAASLYLFEQARGDAEFVDRILRFWAGDALPVPELRRRLKEAGAAGNYALGVGKESGSGWQRFAFLSRLIRAAGYQGWVVMLDEVELIGRYSLLRRGRSYAELARWVLGDATDTDRPLAGVLAIVDDFEEAVLRKKNDPELVTKRMSAKGTVAELVDADLAGKGMRIIESDLLRMQPPDRAALDRTYSRIKALHGAAYGWVPPEVEGLEKLPSNRMRQYVRAWISEWDLSRLDPTFVPETEAAAVSPTISDEEIELESGSEIELTES